MMQDVEACLKPSGVVIFMDGDPRIYLEDDMTPAPVAVDEDEPGGPIEGSWFHRIARGVPFFQPHLQDSWNRSLEVRYALAYDGVDIERSETAMDAGLWDHPLIDKTTVQVGGIFTPIGPWASGKSSHNDPYLEFHYVLQHRTFIKASVSNMLDRWCDKIAWYARSSFILFI
jgi:hypothetical protein